MDQGLQAGLRTGEDYAPTYGRWMDANGVSRESVQVEAENVTRFTLKYNPDGSFSPTPHFSMEHLGYLKTHPEEIDQACAGQAVKGIYMAHNLDPVIWGKLGEVKEKYGFKIMWEIEYAGQIRKMLRLTRQQILDRARRVMEVADLWSINHNEAADLFQLPREDDEAIINELQKLPVEFTFYRVGSRGSYAVTPTNAYFCEAVDPFGPSVDPTGCGNCSTGAAMYAYVSGAHPAMAAIMANISSGFNAAQKGPYPLYTEEGICSSPGGLPPSGLKRWGSPSPAERAFFAPAGPPAGKIKTSHTSQRRSDYGYLQKPQRKKTGPGPGPSAAHAGHPAL